MTIKQGSELIEQLRLEVSLGIDIEFNNNWIKLLQKSIVNSLKFNR